MHSGTLHDTWHSDSMPAAATGGRASVLWRRLSGRRNTRFSILAFAVVATIVSLRVIGNVNVPEQPEAARWGLVDFRDAIYYPVVSFLAGNDPYDAGSYARTYPVASTFALYAPHTLVVHLPFGLLGFERAEALYYGLTLALIPVLALLTLRMCRLDVTPGAVFGLAALIVVSRPGESTLFLGQYTVTIVIGMYLALHCARRRPWVAGVGVAIAVLKPTFGIPLVVILLASGAVRPVAIGFFIAGVLAIVPTWMLVGRAGGPAAFVQVLQDNRAVFSAGQHFVANSGLTRIDAVALVGRLLARPVGGAVEMLIACVILAVGAVGIRFLARATGDASQQLSVTLGCVTALTCVYHQGYDALLLAQPLLALSRRQRVPSGVVRRFLQGVLLAVLTVPAFNYFGTYAAVRALGVTGRAQLLVAGLNSFALFVGLLICLALVLHGRRKGDRIA